jgi:hypothetical protein
VIQHREVSIYAFSHNTVYDYCGYLPPLLSSHGCISRKKYHGLLVAQDCRGETCQVSFAQGQLGSGISSREGGNR